MRINFKALALAPALLALAALVAPTAAAESHVIKVPFDFVAAGHKCPAGNYAVNQDNHGGTVRLISGKASFVWLLQPGDSTVRDHRVVLTFDVAGKDHLLRTVQFGSSITSRIDKESNPAQQVALSR